MQCCQLNVFQLFLYEWEFSSVLTTEKSLPPKDTATHKPQPYKPSSVVWPRGTKFNTS